jgi:ABC-type proline/glycine betaine transport system ATPase subunit
MPFARELANTIAFIADGAIVKSGSPEEIFDGPKESRISEFAAVPQRVQISRRSSGGKLTDEESPAINPTTRKNNDARFGP